MKPRLQTPLLVLLLLALGWAGCGSIVRDKETAANAMDQFHDRFNAGEFDKIYDTADPDFQRDMARSEFLEYMGAVHRKLGNYKTCASQSWSTNTFNSDTTVDLRYKTTFENGGGDENFTFRVSGTRATLRSYHLNSTKLVTD